MTVPGEPIARPEDADPWFVNLEDVANRVTANEKADRRSRRRIYTLTAFVLFAFLSLAFVQQRQIARVDQNTQNIEVTRYTNCLGSIIIIQRFNATWDELTATETFNDVADPKIRERRLAAYENAKIPLPKDACGTPPRGYEEPRGVDP